MKTVLIAAIALAILVPGLAAASPFLVCDPQAGVTHYQLTGPAWIANPVAAQADGSIRMDVAPSAIGTTSLTVKACKTDAVWGESCSDAVPFAYDRPSPAATPDRLRLQK